MNANPPNVASDAPSHDIDHNIDRALAALRDAHPRSGLNSRILASLEHRSLTPAPLRPHLSAHLALWAATSAAILAVASLVILHHDAASIPETSVVANVTSGPGNLSGARSAESKAVSPASVLCSMGCKDSKVAGQPTNHEPFSTTNLARTTHPVSSRPEHRTLIAMRSGETCVADHHKSGCPVHDDAPGSPATLVAGVAVVMSGFTQTDLDAQALADLHAPSHPAPPLPLTPQEKLFLRMLHYGNATQLAELNPLVRAQQDAEETTAYKAFFPDPPPLKQPLGDTE